MVDTALVEKIVRSHGVTDFRWIDPKAIVVAQWVRMKCEFGCRHYGHNATCPPNTPTVDECRRFFAEYSSTLVMHFPKAFANPDERHAWTREVNLGLSEVERDVFLAGHHRAFLLFMDSCGICAECGATRAECKEPRIARPTPEGMAMDVFTTVRQIGYPIEVLTERTAMMNRYAFLMVE
jgi:predicted metal-binding protein